MADFENLSSRELLALHASVGDELRHRAITRSSNNPVGDLAEFLFCRAFGWEMAPKSAKSADAMCSDGKLYQVKGRRITAHNPSRQLGAMRALDAGGFDYLAAVLFTADYSILRAAIIPHAAVLTQASFIGHTNSWKFILCDSVWDWPVVRDVTDALRAVEY